MIAPDKIWLHPIVEDVFQDVWFTEGDGDDVAYVPAIALAEAQAEIARLRDQVGDWIVRADEANARADRMEKALNEIDALDPESMIDGCAQTAIRGLVLRMGEIARAALSPVAQDKGEG